MKKALRVFKSLGATVEEVDLGWTRDAIDTGIAHLSASVRVADGRLLRRSTAGIMTSYAVDFGKKAVKSTPAKFLQSMEGAAKMYETFGPMMEKYDVFICPTNALPAVKADFDERKDEVRINGKVSPLPKTLAWCMTTPFNTLSRCPVLAVPTGHASNGVPTSIQIIGRTYSDADVFRAGVALTRNGGRRLVHEDEIAPENLGAPRLKISRRSRRRLTAAPGLAHLGPRKRGRR